MQQCLSSQMRRAAALPASSSTSTSAAVPRQRVATCSAQQQCSSCCAASATQQPAPQQHSRRQLLQLCVGLAAAAAAAAAAPAPAAAAAASAVSSSRALEEYMKLEDEQKLRDQKALDSIRLKYGIRRSLDGRVQLKRKNGVWMSVRLDMEVPGAILLRDSKSSAVYALETDSLPQVDLSDDYVVLMMFADGQWEEDMTAIEFEEDGGKAAALTMSEKEFHEFVGILKEPDEPAKRR